MDGDRERKSYEADAYLTQLSHYYTELNYQMARDTFHHLMDFPTWPTEWKSHMVFMAHADYMHTGGVSYLQSIYEFLKTKLLLDRADPDGLITSTPKEQKTTDLVDWPPGERDEFVFSRVTTVVNAFHLETLSNMETLARAVGKESEANQFHSQRKATMTQFQEQLFDWDLGLYLDGIDTDHHSYHPNRVLSSDVSGSITIEVR